MLPIPVLLTLGFLLISRKKKSKPSSLLQATQRTSKAAMSLSMQPKGEGLSAQGQLAILKPLLAGTELSSKPKIEGLAPFNLSTNRPDPRQVAILYLIDPQFEITDTSTGQRTTVSDLLPDALWEQPALKGEILDQASHAQRLVLGLTLLPPEKLLSFTSQLAIRTAPLYEEMGVGIEYASCLRLLADGIDLQEQRRLGKISIDQVEDGLESILPVYRSFMRDLERDPLNVGLHFFVDNLWNVVSMYSPKRPKMAQDHLTSALRYIADEVAHRAMMSSHKTLTYEQRQAIYDYEVKKLMAQKEGKMPTLEKLRAMDQDLYEKGLYDKPQGGAMDFLFGHPDALRELEAKTETIAKQHADDILQDLIQRIK